MRSDNGLYPQRRLRELISLEYGDSLPNENRLGGHCPVMGSNGIVGYHDKPKVNGPGIVVGRKGSIGQVTWVSEDFWPIDTTYYVEQKTRHDRHWLYYLLEQLHLEKLNSATGVPGLNREDAYALSVPVPTEVQTRKIAEIVQAIDDAIETTQAVIKQTRQLKTALLQDLLTNGLPGRHETFVNVKRLGKVPATWGVVALDTLIKKDRPICYGILMPGRGHPNGVPVVKVKDIENGKIKLNDLLLTSPDSDEEYRRSRLKAGDLLLSIRGTTGRIAVVPTELEDANITQDTARISVKDSVARDYLYYAFQGPALQQQIQHHTIGQAVKGINIEEVRRLLISLPKENERRTIAVMLRQIDEQLEINLSLLEQLTQNKTSLSQGLLTGRIPVTGGEGSS